MAMPFSFYNRLGLFECFEEKREKSAWQNKWTTSCGLTCVQVSKGKAEHSFFSLPEFEEWKQNTENWHTWKVKYYKGVFLFWFSPIELESMLGCCKVCRH